MGSFNCDLSTSPQDNSTKLAVLQFLCNIEMVRMYPTPVSMVPGSSSIQSFYLSSTICSLFSPFFVPSHHQRAITATDLPITLSDISKPVTRLLADESADVRRFSSIALLRIIATAVKALTRKSDPGNASKLPPPTGGGRGGVLGRAVTGLPGQKANGGRLTLNQIPQRCLELVGYHPPAPPSLSFYCILISCHLSETKILTTLRMVVTDPNSKVREHILRLYQHLHSQIPILFYSHFAQGISLPDTCARTTIL